MLGEDDRTLGAATDGDAGEAGGDVNVDTELEDEIMMSIAEEASIGGATEEPQTQGPAKGKGLSSEP